MPWKIILSGLVMLNAQPNDYSQAKKVHVLLVDARSVAVDSKGLPIAPHVAVLEAPTDRLEDGIQPDWSMTLPEGKRSFFLLNDVSLSFSPASTTPLKPFVGTRIVENGQPRMLPCCVDQLEDCSGIHPDFLCLLGTHPYSDQRRDLTWVTPMADLGGDGKLARGCLPPNFSNCPLVSWFTITEGSLETYRLENEDPHAPAINQVVKTYIDGAGTARAAARDILWTLPAGELGISLHPFRGGPPREIVLTSTCTYREITVHNAPILDVFSQTHATSIPPAFATHLSERHAEHLFRLLASPPSPVRAITREAGPPPTGTGLCPPGDAGGPD